VAADDALLGLYWTTSGPVEVHVGREWSLFSWQQRCEQAARVGMVGLGLWHADLVHLLETNTLCDLGETMDAHGLEYLELEFLMDWFLDPDDERRQESDETRTLLFQAAAELPAHHIKVGNIPGVECELTQVTERYAELCSDATRYTDAKVVYEFMPFDVNVRDLDSALAIVEGANAPNGGLAIDTWHMAKLGIEPEHLRRVPSQHLAWVELNDGQYENMDDLVDETVNHRKLPGEGEFPVRRYVEVCREVGYRGPWGIEVLSEELRNLPIEQIFERAYETSVTQLTTAERERSAGA
jgi:sugar phosphate isomerase/epimerase